MQFLELEAVDEDQSGVDSDDPVEDSYDLNDPFINDVPSDPSSEEDEVVPRKRKRLRRGTMERKKKVIKEDSENDDESHWSLPTCIGTDAHVVTILRDSGSHVAVIMGTHRFAVYESYGGPGPLKETNRSSEDIMDLLEMYPKHSIVQKTDELYTVIASLTTIKK